MSLHLARYVGQAIVVGEGDDQVTVRIHSIVGDRVVLSSDAGKHVPIDREEVRERKDSNQKAA